MNTKKCPYCGEWFENDARDHFKNGTTLKSLTSKRKSSSHLKRISVLVALAASLVSGYGQTDYRNLVSNAFHVEYKSDYGGNIWFHIPNLEQGSYGYRDENLLGVINLLKKDVIAYYGLEKKYDTELKRKVFSTSQERRELYTEMEIFYNEVIKKDFYYLHDFEGTYKTKYNLSTQSMETDIGIDARAPYLVLLTGNLSLSIPKAVTSYATWTGHFRNVSIPLKDETQALEIEENIEDCALLIVFNLEGTTKRAPVATSGSSGVEGQDFILGKTKYAYIVNKKTGKIYSDSPEIRELERRAKELNYQNSIESARRNFEQQQYQQAKRDYLSALELKPDNANFINSRIREIERIEQQAQELASTTNHGNAGGQGSQGIPDIQVYGEGSDAVANKWGLEGRGLVGRLPLPDYNVWDEGTVVVSITVDKDGNVTKATPGDRGSTTLNKSLLDAAEKAARQAKFTRNPNAIEQTGTITYIFTRE